MDIYIDGKKAAIKKGSSVEFVSENRLFTDSDGYTLNISLPLKGCDANLDIFGHINRPDVSLDRLYYPCEIRDVGFSRSGLAAVTEISDAEVKLQFLEGRSAQNYDKSLDDVFINELDLGSPDPQWQKFDVRQSRMPANTNFECVAFPWVNEGSGIMQNALQKSDGKDGMLLHDVWHSDCEGRSWFPFLCFITKKIAEKAGFSIDISLIENDARYKNIIICNALPYTWDVHEYARALPHWSVSEYFNKLELFLGGEFSIDYTGNHISFGFTDSIQQSKEVIKLDKVVDEFSTSVSDDGDRCGYYGCKNLLYKDCSNEVWKFYSCDWFIRSYEDSIARYDDPAYLSQLMTAVQQKGVSSVFNKVYKGILNSVYYVKSLDSYFVPRVLGEDPKRKGMLLIELRPLNLFGGRIVDPSEEAESVEIEFCPACVDYADENYGRVVYLPLSGYEEPANDDFVVKDSESTVNSSQTTPVDAIKAGNKEKRPEYLDRIFVAQFDNRFNYLVVEDVECDDGVHFQKVNSYFRLNTSDSRQSKIFRQIDPCVKTSFKFLCDHIPDVRAEFIIKGKKYLCEKITATFNDNGMSQLLKGDFYPVVDDSHRRVQSTASKVASKVANEVANND